MIALSSAIERSTPNPAQTARWYAALGPRVVVEADATCGRADRNVVGGVVAGRGVSVQIARAIDPDPRVAVAIGGIANDGIAGAFDFYPGELVTVRLTVDDCVAPGIG